MNTCPALIRVALLITVLSLAAFGQSPSGSGPNLLLNDGFDLGPISQVAPPNWQLFGNGGVADNLSGVPPITAPNSGFLFGSFPPAPCPSTSPCDSVLKQTVPALFGEAFALTVNAHHPPSNPLQGQSFVIAVMEFSTAGIVLGSQSTTVLTTNSPTGTWIPTVLQGVAPPGTNDVSVILVFIQLPHTAQGVCHFDDISVQRLSPSLTMTRDPLTSNITNALSKGSPGAFYGQLFSFDLLNSSAPLLGFVAGMHLDPAATVDQINLALAQIPPFGGFLDGTGSATTVIPGTVTFPFAGFTLYSVAIEVQLAGLSASNVTSVIL